MNRADRMELLRTVSSFVLLLVMVSIMGWCTIPPREDVKPYLVYDNRIIKEDIVRNQAAAMAKATAVYNAWLEQRGKK